MSGDVAARLLEHLNRTALFRPPGRALLAVSGGLDSIALVDLLTTLATDLQLECAIGHVEHGITPATEAAVSLVERLAEHCGIPSHVERLELGAEAGETVARKERYRALRAIQRRIGASYLVTAHHADDQVETILYRFLRGSGVAGLAGIPARGPGGLVRPLLIFTRQELSAWVKGRTLDAQLGSGVFEDPANWDERHDRTWLRRRLLPSLRDRLGDSLDRNVERVGDDAALDRRAWAEVIRTLPELEFRHRAGWVEVARAPLVRYDKVLSQAILRAFARELGIIVGPERAARLVRFVMESKSGRQCQLGGGWVAEIVFDRLRLSRSRARTTVTAPAQTTWGETERGSTRWDAWELRWHRELAGAPERESLTTWVTLGVGHLRAARPADRLVPLGGVGHRKVRRLLMEARIPARDRPHYPVVVRGSDVLWIPGICRSATGVPSAGEPAMRLDARST